MSEWKERSEYTPVPRVAPARGAGQRMPDAFEGGNTARGADSADEADGLRIFRSSGEGDGSCEEEPAVPSGAPVRAINEDDDGYDPYSDWHDQGPSMPLFERDPWE